MGLIRIQFSCCCCCCCYMIAVETCNCSSHGHPSKWSRRSSLSVHNGNLSCHKSKDSVYWLLLLYDCSGNMQLFITQPPVKVVETKQFVCNQNIIPTVHNGNLSCHKFTHDLPTSEQICQSYRQNRHFAIAKIPLLLCPCQQKYVFSK